MWADALFVRFWCRRPEAAGSPRKYWTGTKPVCGFCRECRGAVFVKTEYDQEALDGHRAWHDELYKTICIVNRTAHIHGKGE
jgi:hypothetical protein